MNARKSLVVLLAVVFAASFGFGAWAAGQDLKLMPLKASPKASGTIQLSKDRLKIDVQGLKPASVYTVWLVNMKPKKEQAGAGKAPYMFKTDSAGKGSYDSSLSESPFGRWSTIMVVLHPSGDPMDMKKMAPAFSAMIPASAK